jgi:multidrug resistance efflux pump
MSAQASVAQATAQRGQARVNLERTQIRSPVNGWITNLLVRVGDYAAVGRNVISIADADSFWVDAYFEETQLASVREGDPAEIKLMGYSEIVRGHVGGVARAIDVMQTPIIRGSRTSTRYPLGFASLNACRSASKSIRSLKAFAWLPA